MKIEMYRRTENGRPLTSTVWRPGPGHRAISSATLGGGIGSAGWVLNAQVPGTYARMDPAEHLRELAAAYGLQGPGVGMLTAASVDRTVERSDSGVAVSATVGLRVPTWAAAPPDAVDPELAPIQDIQTPGTVNIVVSVPVPLTDAALVNAVITATEAKTQALMEAGYPCTGTASDAICIVTPETPGAPETLSPKAADPFAGPRSTWGSRLARAVHAAVRDGAIDYTTHL
ncbi:adenosylcobinamide amidohydrolase [Actinomadura barringtoniae]|uniref:Adenosylcobinamide amidohydrolase n=1 Tax=Actinomadura barringtoniae TaxID=1427535 RepID=A0A939PEG2_9ACTN|nr:adenosylcobinamide amidohydrolase [Actinomadura barringtoniae]MBO2451085.1 adenosylcobinamide amidohydrolase [Actinomadura barringtoniae]